RRGSQPRRRGRRRTGRRRGPRELGNGTWHLLLGVERYSPTTRSVPSDEIARWPPAASRMTVSSRAASLHDAGRSRGDPEMKHALAAAILTASSVLTASAAPAPKAEPAAGKKEDTAIQQIDQQIAKANIDKSSASWKTKVPKPTQVTFDT